MHPAPPIECGATTRRRADLADLTNRCPSMPALNSSFTGIHNAASTQAFY
jgi:hypothetical protein